MPRSCPAHQLSDDVIGIATGGDCQRPCRSPGRQSRGNSRGARAARSPRCRFVHAHRSRSRDGGGLLRAHPLLDDCVIGLGFSSAFGRSLSYGGVEAQRWFDKPLLARLGMARFVDVARTARRAAGDASPTNVDVGAGLRLRIPGTVGVLRADVAHGVRDGANAFTFGWQF